MLKFLSPSKNPLTLLAAFWKSAVTNFLSGRIAGVWVSESQSWVIAVLGAYIYNLENLRVQIGWYFENSRWNKANICPSAAKNNPRIQVYSKQTGAAAAVSDLAVILQTVNSLMVKWSLYGESKSLLFHPRECLRWTPAQSCLPSPLPASFLPPSVPQSLPVSLSRNSTPGLWWWPIFCVSQKLLSRVVCSLLELCDAFMSRNCKASFFSNVRRGLFFLSHIALIIV